MFISDWSALMTPQKATLDSMRTLTWFVSYSRLLPMFQFSLSGALGLLLRAAGQASNTDHRVYRVTEYPGPSSALAPPVPFPQASVSPPPGSKWGDTHSLVGRG
jgi:hypothetical protein